MESRKEKDLDHVKVAVDLSAALADRHLSIRRPRTILTAVKMNEVCQDLIFFFETSLASGRLHSLLTLKNIIKLHFR